MSENKYEPPKKLRHGVYPFDVMTEYVRADLVDGLVEALESMYEIAKDVEDSGPLHEGWQSNALVEELRKAQAALAALKEEE